MDKLNANIYVYALFVVAAVTLVILYSIKKNGAASKENFSNNLGRLCSDCENKTFSQCTNCFNCGYCIDQWGNGKCIGGDYKGPYNYETCAFWYNSDPWTKMTEYNIDYKRSYGPKQGNRIIGVNPTC